jgi:hypothetical protein
MSEDLISEQNMDSEELKKAVEVFETREEKPASEEVVEEPPKVEFVPRKKTPAEMVELVIATERFKGALKERSFSGRNPELGPMIKCVRCGQRHRDNVKHDEIKYKEGTTQSEGGRRVANPVGWRAKPGKPVYIPQLKKVVTINS